MSQKFIKHCISDSRKQTQSYSNTLSSLISSKYPLILKVKLIEGFKQELLMKIKQAQNLKVYVNGQYNQQKHQDALWEEIDVLESKILEAKNERIRLQLHKEDYQQKYEEEMEVFEGILREKQKILGGIIDEVSKVSGRCSRTKFHSKEEEEEEMSTVENQR